MQRKAIRIHADRKPYLAIPPSVEHTDPCKSRVAKLSRPYQGTQFFNRSLSASTPSMSGSALGRVCPRLLAPALAAALGSDDERRVPALLSGEIHVRGSWPVKSVVKLIALGNAWRPENGCFRDSGLTVLGGSVLPPQDTPSCETSGLVGQGADVITSTTHSDATFAGFQIAISHRRS